MDISGNFALVEFGRIFWLVEFSGFFVYRVGIGGIFMFWFGVIVRGNI